jgi:hypothetical protein
MSLPDTATDSAPAAGLWAMLSLTLETTATAVRSHLSRRERLMQSMHRVPVTGPAISQPGITDQPRTMGPQLGRAWDVKRLTLASANPASPWTGEVYVYTGFPSASNLVDIFTGPDTHHYPKATVLLTGSERVVLVAGPDYAGIAVPGGAAVEFTDECLPDYLT